ncbi:MAG: HPF/RaiA family ribosome-associated protein [Flavobacteriaceae bacterium]|nr:HPF/RaiA family ribosome-associated protein [Flavobacteriaceae bacterium]MCY4298739.1 HPF/RaiA family ribosome-associated protein [Flavobacteriaceae bacterium]
MNIRFRAVNYSAQNDLIDFANKRVGKIGNFYNRIIGIEVTTKITNSSDPVNKVAELRCLIPGDDVIVRKKAKSFEEAIANASDTAERTLKKRKDRVKDK